MKKPITKYNDGNKAKTWIISISLQLWAMLITFFTGREITHAFYYSEEEEKASIILLPVKFKGKKYTEMRPLRFGLSNWPDAKLIGVGSEKDVDWSECNKN